MALPWILISIVSLAIILVVLGIYSLRGGNWNRKVDYRSYYVMGVSWFPLGIALWIVLDMSFGVFFFIMGLIYMAIGLKNRDKWGKPQRVNPNFQKMLVIAVAFGVVALVAGILVFEFMLL